MILKPGETSCLKHGFPSRLDRARVEEEAADESRDRVEEPRVRVIVSTQERRERQRDSVAKLAMDLMMRLSPPSILMMRPSPPHQGLALE